MSKEKAMPAETARASWGSTVSTRRGTLLLVGAAGLALAEIVAHPHVSLAGKHHKQNTHKKCNKRCKKNKKQCDKACDLLQTDVDLCKNECQIAKKQCKKTC